MMKATCTNALVCVNESLEALRFEMGKDDNKADNKANAEKPVSLRPLTVEEALSGIVKVKPPKDKRSKSGEDEAQKKTGSNPEE